MPRKVKILIVTLILAIPAAYLLASSMGMGRGMMGQMSQNHAWFNGETIPLDLKTPRPPENEASIKAGQKIYESRCAACHGSMGDGKTEEAKKLNVKPADFTSGTFKFRSTLDPAPTNLDLFKTISQGLHGTAMLPWIGLSTTEKWQAAYYIKTFTDLFEDIEPEVYKIPPPIMSIPQYVRLGREIYRQARCYECHGFEGRGDGEKAGNLKDDNLRPISPRNFKEEFFKRGSDIEEIYYTVATGLNGTPMESFYPILRKGEMLAVSYYVQSIARKISVGGMMMGNTTPDEQIGMRIYRHGR